MVKVVTVAGMLVIGLLFVPSVAANDFTEACAYTEERTVPVMWGCDYWGGWYEIGVNWGFAFCENSLALYNVSGYEAGTDCDTLRGHGYDPAQAAEAGCVWVRDNPYGGPWWSCDVPIV